MHININMVLYIDACVLLDNTAVNVIHLNKEGKIHIFVNEYYISKKFISQSLQYVVWLLL